MNKKKKEAIWTCEGKELSNNELADKFVKQYFKEFNPSLINDDKSKKEISLIEIMLFKIIYIALKQSKKHEMKDDMAVAMFIVGYLSSKISLDDLIIDLKNPENKKSKYTKK